MLQAVLSICINFFLAVLGAMLNSSLSHGGQLLYAAYGSIAVLLSTVGLTTYASNRSKAGANLAQVGFLLCFPIGLIGFFGLRRHRSQEVTEDQPEESVNRKMNTIFIPMIVIFSCLFITGLFAPHFFNHRNIINLFRQLSAYAILSFGVIMLAREDQIDVSMPALMVLSSIIFTHGTASPSPLLSGTLIALSLITVLLFALLHTILISMSNVTSLSMTLLSSLVAIGISLSASQGQVIKAEHARMAQIPGSWLIFILIGAAVIFLGILATSGRFDSDKFPSRRTDMFLSWMAFGGAALMSLLAGIYRSARIAAATPATPRVDIAFILFSFFFLRAFSPGTLKKYGLVLALLPALAWVTISNQLSLGGVTSNFHLIIDVYPVIVMGVVSYFIRRSNENLIPDQVKPSLLS